MVVIRLLDSSHCWFLLSMFFSNPGNGGGFAAEAKGSSNGNGLFSSGGGGSGVWAGTSVDASKVAIAVTALAGLALAATIIYSRSGSPKSPWSRRRRKNALAPQQWESLFSPDGKLRDGGVKFLKKVRSGGVDPSIRPEVWPFLLGVYNLNSSKSERNAIRRKNRREYEKLRRKCLRLAKQINESFKKPKEVSSGHSEDTGIFIEKEDSPVPEDLVSGRQSISIEETNPDNFEMELQGDEDTPHSKPCMEPEEEDEGSSITHVDAYAADTESSGSESSAEESEKTKLLRPTEENEEIDPKVSKSDSFDGRSTKAQSAEDIATWQRIIRLDAIRANAEWVIYSPSQAAVSEEKALELAEAVGLKDYDHLEPCRIFHAARLVAILEAYALYDAEIGYCQGMSDLLSPIIAVIEEDYEAFWCFVGFMRKARHNFRLDEVGIRRQLNIVSKIIKSKDSQLYRHLEKLQAEDCFFVYRMVVVLFRRELDFEQTLCLWEVMWADQAAIRAGIGKSAWGRVRMRAPPTEDLLLYAIAACVLQRRKLIIERYSSMDEILRECNSMVGQLDVWKLLDDAHVLVVTLHDKI